MLLTLGVGGVTYSIRVRSCDHRPQLESYISYSHSGTCCDNMTYAALCAQELLTAWTFTTYV